MLYRDMQPHLDFVDCKLCNRERVISPGELEMQKPNTVKPCADSMKTAWPAPLHRCLADLI